MSAERDLARLLVAVQPSVRDGEFVFVTVSSPDELPAEATVREDEGWTCVVRRDDADRLRLPYDFVAAWITLDVHSALEAVGLTAAVSTALADAAISCNVLAGACHDHLLVPADRAGEAVAILRSLGEDGPVV